MGTLSKSLRTLVLDRWADLINKALSNWASGFRYAELDGDELILRFSSTADGRFLFPQASVAALGASLTNEDAKKKLSMVGSKVKEFMLSRGVRLAAPAVSGYNFSLRGQMETSIGTASLYINSELDTVPPLTSIDMKIKIPFDETDHWPFFEKLLRLDDADSLSGLDAELANASFRDLVTSREFSVLHSSTALWKEIVSFLSERFVKPREDFDEHVRVRQDRTKIRNISWDEVMEAFRNQVSPPKRETRTQHIDKLSDGMIKFKLLGVTAAGRILEMVFINSTLITAFDLEDPNRQRWWMSHDDVFTSHEGAKSHPQLSTLFRDFKPLSRRLK